jgi:energy-coupling factor transporter ATP-binding protein EcfA2
VGLHEQLGTFGDVAAEDDDAVLSYFLKTQAVSDIEAGKALVVLGRKGSGKTAIAKYFEQSGPGYLSTSLSLRDYPWKMHEQRVNTGASQIESYVSSWRYLIAVKSLSMLLERSNNHSSDSQRSALAFLHDNYGGVRPTLADILRPPRIKLTKASFQPSIMGNSIGGVDLETAKGNVAHEIDALTDILLETALTIGSQIGCKKILLHFDELDQGLAEIDDTHQKMIVGLVLACRSVRANSLFGVNISPIAYLRTDIWDEFRFSDKNKISHTSAVELEWSSDSLFALINERIKAKLGARYSWDDLDDGSLMRGSQSKWNHIVSRTFLRPRDVIQFLNCALQVSLGRIPDSDRFDNEDIQLAREPYSRYLKQELDDELGPHWESWTDSLRVFSELATITFSRSDFVEAYEQRKSKKNIYDSDEALEKLYKFSIIGYRRGIGKGGSGWVFQYTDPQAGWDSAASRLKVHLGLKEFAKLREVREDRS